MIDFIEIFNENIIKEAMTENPSYGNKLYIVYINPNDDFRQKIRVNTYFLPYGTNVHKLCFHYDRGLCNTLEEYHELSIEYIESQAYGSWMDGAR